MYKCILFLGLGGAGQRHLRILRERLPNARMIGVRKTGKTPVLNSDFTVKNGATLESEYDIEFFKDVNKAYEQKPELVVIAVEPVIISALLVPSDALNRILLPYSSLLITNVFL